MTNIKNVTAIVLAAGISERFQGGNKLLADFHRATVLGKTLQNLKDAGIAGILVIVGHDQDAVRAALAGEIILENPDYKKGIATSIAAGIRTLGKPADGALIVLGDMPLVRPKTVRALAQALDPETGKTIAVPTHKGKSGNPVLWHRDFFSALMALTGNRGAKSIIRNHPDAVALVAVDDPGIHIDFDTREALDAHLKGA